MKIIQSNVLIVAAHPDDEVLGCGGTMARHVAEGDNVYVLIMADGVTSRGGNNLLERYDSADNAAKILGINPPNILGLPDNKLDTIPLLDIVKMIESVINDVRPTIVYTHHYGDLNIDHAITHRAVMTACRPVPNQTVHSIYGFEILSSTDWNGEYRYFKPCHYVDVFPYVDKKIDALKCYSEEVLEFPHARSLISVNALLQFRGAQTGLMAAEAFTILRQIRVVV
jgi:N-acetylglucosamine malate deacetylase 1